jgi:hypothetical protein
MSGVWIDSGTFAANFGSCAVALSANITPRSATASTVVVFMIVGLSHVHRRDYTCRRPAFDGKRLRVDSIACHVPACLNARSKSALWAIALSCAVVLHRAERRDRAGLFARAQDRKLRLQITFRAAKNMCDRVEAKSRCASRICR